MLNGSPRRVAIVGSCRIPFARSNTIYSDLNNAAMLTDTLKGLVKKFQLENVKLGEVVGGAVQKHSFNWNLVRECVLGSGLHPHTPAYDIQQACGTGLEATILVANKIALGQIDSGIACGTDTVSDIPIHVNKALQRGLLKANAAKTTKEKLISSLKILKPSNFIPQFPAKGEPRTGLSMGEHAQITAKRFNISRRDQDYLAFISHQNLEKAYNSGFFDDLIIPYHGLTKDNNLRSNITLEKMASLSPAFDQKEGTITAANSTPFTDGASAVLLASEEWAKARNLPILAYITAGEVAAVDYIDEREGLLMAGAYAIPSMLKKCNLSLQDFDFYEIHEAFAAVVLCTLAALESDDYAREKLGLEKGLGKIDYSKLNVKGGSIATGHPFAATGGRIVGTLAKILDENKGGRGLISICAAGGQAVTAILEK
ncbi:acetyl-CoA C-acetyltransferase [Acinetobacter courvalinii]|uniref:acetyl-CoA C-acetyltransferase n=1 Tax=Acinetobacter courvalinii TaxID=280147 RepID=UPI003F55DCFB